MGGVAGGLLATFERAGRIFLVLLVGREAASRSNRASELLRVTFGGAVCGFTIAAVIAAVLFAFDTSRYRYDGEVFIPLGAGLFGGFACGLLLLFLVEVLNHSDKPKDKDAAPE